MNNKTKQKIILYNIISSIISSIIILLIISILLFIFKKNVINYIKIINISYIALVIFLLIETFINPFIKVKTYNYKITANSFEYTKGIISKSKTIIPMSKIQQIIIINGPILNAFGLVEAEILTTGNKHNIKNITISEGDILVSEITKLLHHKSNSALIKDSKLEEKNETY